MNWLSILRFKNQFKNLVRVDGIGKMWKNKDSTFQISATCFWSHHRKGYKVTFGNSNAAIENNKGKVKLTVLTEGKLYYIEEKL